MVSRRGSRVPKFRPTRLQIIGLAVIVALVQRIGLLVMSDSPARTMFLDVLIVAANCVAIGCCLAASKRGRGTSRIFWLLFACAFTLQLVAGVSWAWCHYFHIVFATPGLFPSLFYRLYVGPMAIALFLSDDVYASRLEGFFHGSIVVGLVGLTMFQLQMAELSAHDPSLWRVIGIGAAVNFVLILGAIARFAFSSPGTLHGLFARQAIYLSIYSFIALVTGIGDAYFPSIDPVWIVIYLSGAVLAATWQPSSSEQTFAKPRIGRRAGLLCFNLTVAAMVLGCTVLGFLVVNSTRLVGLVAISVVLMSYAVRGALMQDNQEKYLSALQESKAQLQHQALYDELTGLANRRLFADRLSQTLALARRHEYTVGLVYIDLDGFKAVNDELGHAVGDRLLHRAAVRMLSRIRASDTLARMGGDEFALLLAHIAGEQNGIRVANDLLKSLAGPFHIDGHEIQISASLGIGVSHLGVTDAEGLIHQADSAMYAAKRSGGNSVKCYLPELEPSARNRPN
jgi:diguanylate cyclase (GGDEF)-like protein